MLTVTVVSLAEAVTTNTLSLTQFTALPPPEVGRPQVVPPSEQTSLLVVRYQNIAPGLVMGTSRLPALYAAM